MIIVRHATAPDVGEQGIRRDEDRPLSPPGRKESREAALALRRIGCRPNLIAASPLVRAQQTARILTETFTGHTVATCEPMRPNTLPGRLLVWLGGRQEACILLVGHQPHAANALSQMLVGSTDLDMKLGKAGACCIHFDGPARKGRAQLMWLLQRSQLRCLAHT